MFSAVYRHDQDNACGTCDNCGPLKMGGGLSRGSTGSHSDYKYGATGDDDDGKAVSCTWIGKTMDLPPKTSVDAQFAMHSVLGTGMLGCVRLVQHKKTKKFFALKSMKKDDVISQSMLKHVETEREALQKLSKLRHPFLVKYFGSMQSPSHIHLLLEYAPGGELLHRLHQVGGKFSHDEAKFYATELVAFIGFCHEQGYMYRDLKPENVLLDAQGHIKVVDLGFVRKISGPTDRCSTCVGTPQYLAPEQLTQSKEKRSYTCAVDWWALGCMIFEMVAGKTPFAGPGSSKLESQFEVYTRIIQGRINWPPGLHSTLKDLLRRMLTPELSRRLCDADAIKQHAWFADVDWQEVLRADVLPPYRPTLYVEGDRSCFDEYPVEQKETVSFKAALTLPAEFRNF